ncbi:type II toxin-antitoxin system prevent-host-death family antitoxin [Parenemella sanctibonifatiensis]|uniref:Type II toxin-antitoxin system prevent-host-death family antitoxin n=1 Tax=Parenemella sanctibonifatiensis TaxID=2016505 RepID=A0A255EIX4_9ACTN|nr:type II toxin-antitoxin system prevent-host-death family antitoxin [Parenemella sanctibonifatiensis]
MRDLRNRGADVLRRVERGERLVVTRDGEPVAELGPVAQGRVAPAELIRRRRHLPRVDPGAWRADVDELLDSSL